MSNNQSVDDHGPGLKGEIREESILRQSCQEIRRTHSISDRMKGLLQKTFEKNFLEAMKLVNDNRVSLFRFSPSGRVVWVVRGRKKEYQVVPQGMFCTCDDYYFRVMGRKKQLCYHLLAQYLAEALGIEDRNELVDAAYSDFTARWKPDATSERT